MAASADAVVTNNATQFGTIVSVSQDGVSYRSGCAKSGQTSSIPWADTLFVQFDEQCSAHTPKLPTAGLTHCDTARQHVYKIRFANSARVIYASQVTVDSKAIVRAVLPLGGGTLSADRLKAGISSIQPADVCPSIVPASQTWPVAFCHDPTQFAVNWSPVPVSDNHVFTRGSSIYLDIHGAGPADAEQVRAAFSTALALWASSLAMHPKLLDDQMRSYISQSTSSSAHFSLFTPPQVVAVRCPADALMVVMWIATDETPFGVGKQDLIALSQVQGRTLLLNAHDNTFSYRPDFLRPIPRGHVNLLSVFVHELGHSFGLPDRASGDSVMNPDYVTADETKAVEPTELDIADFARVLRESIIGTAPGFFRADDCAGLKRHTNKPVNAQQPASAG
jgi:hypothetical protein